MQCLLICVCLWVVALSGVRRSDRPGSPVLESVQSVQPNIVFIVADDLGHADIGYSEGNHQTPTPNIDKLAWDGVILNRHYVNPICTPTRSALMTGRYTFTTGMNTAITIGEPWGLPLNLKILPQYLKDLNYNTYMLGKWHLGAHTRAYYPGARGFDYWFGYLEGDLHLFNYTTGWFRSPSHAGTGTTGRNLYENGYQVPQNCTNNHYLPDLMVEKFEQIIHNSDPSKPFYVHFASPLPRADTEWDETDEVQNVQFMMPRYGARPAVRSIGNEFAGRKRQLAKIQALDEQVGRITVALENKGVLNNTIIVFMADNGGCSRICGTGYGRGANYGSSWPLRMFKGTLFEGSVRGLAYIWSPLLRRRGVINEQLFHVTDWLPTLYEAAGGKTENFTDISGISQWKYLVNGKTVGPRTELVLNIHPSGSPYAMIYKDLDSKQLYKLIRGNVYNNSYTGWERTEGTSDVNEMRTPTRASVRCGHPEGVERTICRPWLTDCLFDLTGDPCETDNIAASHPAMVKLLKDKILVYNLTTVPSAVLPYEANANPSLWDGWWVPWLDPAPVLRSPPCVPFSPSSAF